MCQYLSLTALTLFFSASQIIQDHIYKVFLAGDCPSLSGMSATSRRIQNQHT